MQSMNSQYESPYLAVNLCGLITGITKTHAIDIHTLADGTLKVCDQHLSTLVT